jgi:hypothetical protein
LTINGLKRKGITVLTVFIEYWYCRGSPVETNLSLVQEARHPSFVDDSFVT